MSACPSKFAVTPARIGPRGGGTSRNASALDGVPEDAIVLRDGAVFALEPSTDALLVHCLAGNAWLTQTGDGKDVILNPGDVHFLRRDGKVVVQALSDVALRLSR
jgi:hypothetical protein